MKGFFRIFITFSLLFLFGAVTLLTCDNNKSPKQKTKKDPLSAAEYIGRASCATCHKMEHDLFQHSDHDLAMDSANSETVLGDFNNVTFTHLGITSKFYTKEDQYYVFTEGPGGEMHEYKISFTFGVVPLQQYLIEFPGGAYQCLPIAWDTRPTSDGGQRWYHLYGDEKIAHDDILYWTRTTQNWNYMCSECHSTNTQKNYNYETKTYNTTWNEIDVSCESCHGPGSVHLDWANKVEEGASPEIYADMGLVVRLKDTDNATWVFDPDSTTARRSVPRQTDELVQMCSRCHSRRSVITEEYYHGGSLLETHWPSLLDEGLYFADGQIQDEVYVYGSFLQSKMYMSGVVCKDCHEPHSGKIYVNGNGLCYRCHMASEYGGRSHHFHDPAKEGASCMECHMHERTYMVIDPRRDHSIRIPRPDLSEKLGTPNACNQCHTDKSNQWSADYLEKWYGKDLLNTEHYGEAFWAGRQSYPEALPKLIKLAENKENATMVRATAISILNNYSDPGIEQLISKTIRDIDPLIRYASISVAQYSNNQSAVNMIINSLNDSVKLVRIMAANALSRFNLEGVPASKKELYKKVLDEYYASLLINADHPGTHVNYGNLHLNQNELAEAEASYLEAIEIEPGLVTAYINLADLYRRQNRDAEGEKILLSALEKYPDMAPISYSLGLLQIRNGDQESAMVYLEKAARLAPEVAQYSYVYGIGLNSSKKVSEALSFLESALIHHPYDRNILYILTTINIEQQNMAKATKYAKKLVEYYPADQSYKQVLEYLETVEH
ncbi:MAG: multiheme c-type cytochrome [Bacteroidales bacterium]|jgi:predicted CXXCH cytochrome family protein|nr:multiheme c-type cytochrome [Bacteroidales bacterium]